MKKLRIIAMLLCFVLLLSACTPATGSQNTAIGAPTTEPPTTEGPTTEDPTTNETTVPDNTTGETTEPDNTIAQRPMASVAMPITTEIFTANDGTVIFKYTHQSMALILPDPDVASAVILDFLNRVKSTASAADILRAQAETDYAQSFLWEAPYQCQITYSPMRLDHGVLSVYGNSYTYTGSGRPDVSYLAANYDLVTGKVLYLPDIFATDSWEETITTLVLEALSAQKEQAQLYDDYAATVTAHFKTDLSKNEGWYFTDAGLCFYFPPYEIAPYASGTIVAEIPYEKLTTVLNGAFFPAERDSAIGNVTIEKFENANVDQFSQISELILDENGPMLLIYTDSYVQDIRITVTNIAEGRMESSIFATYTLTPGDAILVQLPNNNDKITLYYTSTTQHTQILSAS